MGVGAKS